MKIYIVFVKKFLVQTHKLIELKEYEYLNKMEFFNVWFIDNS